MHAWRKLSKLAAVATLAGSLALTGTSAAAAGEVPAQENAAARTCGTGVFLDGIRALTVTENGRDEVYIRSGGTTKIWPVTADYVSMAPGQRVEVDKCLALPAVLALMEYDDIGPDDRIGTITIRRDATLNYEFCCDGGGKYRIGAVR
ncbi:hypothetical protein [Nonomuraea sp. NPDC046570]|uniref:hypothetical protein n=1 Tax=Nonomuraea sp. NPDC046570 TaxID=3155255 RepID=UPI0033CA226E